MEKKYRNQLIVKERAREHESKREKVYSWLSAVQPRRCRSRPPMVNHRRAPRGRTYEWCVGGCEKREGREKKKV